LEFIEVVRRRRSIRRYKTTPIPEEVLNEILEAARLAPSAGNRQPWHFLVVRDDDTKQQLGISSWVAGAPAVILGCVDTRVRDEPLCIVDLSIAFEHIVLAAANLGLGTCWIGRFVAGSDEAVKRVLGIPKHVKVVAVTPLGYPDETPEPKARKSLSEIVHYDRF